MGKGEKCNDCSCNPPKALEIKCPDTTYPPRPGMYRNVLLVYKANNHIYMYSSDGIPTFISSGEDGTKDYEKLINKPQINDVELIGNKSFEDLDAFRMTNTDIQNIIDSVV